VLELPRVGAWLNPPTVFHPPKSLHLCGLGASRRIKQKIKKRYSTTRVFSRVHPDHPRCRSATWICMCGHTRDVVIYIPSFIEIRSGVSEPHGGQNLGFPITLAIRFYNSLAVIIIHQWICLATSRGALSLPLFLSCGYHPQKHPASNCKLIIQWIHGAAMCESVCLGTARGCLSTVPLSALTGQYTDWPQKIAKFCFMVVLC